MKKYITSTTIQPPTEATRKFAEMQGWTLVVAGDTKTPHNLYKDMKNVVYISPEDQEKMDKELSDLIGWRSIQRRNFAFLWAWKHGGADLIATVDDDNIPYDNWGQNIVVNKEIEVDKFVTKNVAFNPLSVTNHHNLSHRGFPIQLLADSPWTEVEKVKISPDIEASLWDGDPDIDQICRYQYRPECKFDKVEPFTSNAIMPFNSQNTFVSKSMAPYYSMLPHVGRADDIWPSFMTQAFGGKVVFTSATVYQQRNPQNEIGNMKKEYVMYENNLSILTEMTNTQKADVVFKYCSDYRAQLAYYKYMGHFE